MTIQEKLSLIKDNPAISWHEHIHTNGLTIVQEYTDVNVRVMEEFGIDKAVISRPYSLGTCEPEVFRAYNDLVAETVKRYPDKFIGMAYVDPGFTKEAIYELERCVKELGFRGGVKLYHQYFMCDPAQYPLIEKCIELNVPITMHCAHIMDPYTKRRQPRCSGGDHMALAAKRYPEATFVMGHIGGGGDWKWQLKAIKDTPNVYTDIGGSVHDRLIVEETVKMLGADRVLFASDGQWASTIGKLLGAEISLEDKKTILAGGRFAHFLEAQLVDYLNKLSYN